eukprot:Gb_29571 [translate_table: standard]
MASCLFKKKQAEHRRDTGRRGDWLEEAISFKIKIRVMLISLVFSISCRSSEKEILEYLQGNPLWLQYLKAPLSSLGYETKYDVFVKAEGGGLSGQAQAVTLGISRALLKANPENRDPLKKQGLLTRDSRRVERKKFGLHKARKAPQYSKR